ncbi:hypothetical protein B1748_00900 [Paenibacillus sp. MY03]|uniref:hypothetical protein n=1 Tax=Paenibacillus sp. MY03 TaxID=302980 RepID=UPI000B3CF2F4|nr:hypothetical protein [Paenibacillus sp. MY03]OUS78667.1 hypothetical protein B1748_00900 [Paenibacillus sp. MY03]
MSALRLMQKSRKGISILLAISLVLSLWPISQVSAAVKDNIPDVAVLVGNALIGNQSEDPGNMFSNFAANTPGFSYRTHVVETAGLSGGTIRMRQGGWIELEINVRQNETLRQLAASGHAEVEMGWANLFWSEEGFPNYNYQGTYAHMIVENNGIEVERLEEEAWHGGVGSRSLTANITTDSVIKIRVAGVRDHIQEKPVGVDRMYVHFKDEVAPVLTAYTFGGNGLQRTNPNTGQQELYVKENEYINLTYQFSEPVRPYGIVPKTGNVLPPDTDAFLRHELFVNEDGTGLPAQGQQQYLINQQYDSTENSLKKYYKSITYNYTGTRYHTSGNLPLEPAISGTTDANNGMLLGEKLKEAEFIDAAGNGAVINYVDIKPDSASDQHIRGKNVNDPFNFDRSGFRIIVDAVRPKYSKTSNGIQPEILTGVTVNDNDTIDFAVQFTEEVTAWRNHTSSWDPAGMFLQFNNGMKAYYKASPGTGVGTKTWLFSTTLTDDIDLETPLLKVIMLAHDNKPTDTLVVQDYAGNLLFQPANYKGNHVDGDTSYMDSTIDWANLMIDNTPPTIGFFFEDEGATAETYRKNGKVTIAADDPVINVPPLEPTIPGIEMPTVLPSRGIYRPSNMTGEAAPSVGLVYYVWSQSQANPFGDKGIDEYAALKRFSLTGKQPREDLYPSEYADLNLAVVNNKTSMIAPPSEALLPANSGVWYMHAWTADMTWDSARELAQYAKMKTYIADHPDQYQAWKDERDGSEPDKIIYADAKALAAVGDYADLDIWSLEDFKQDDSNWQYGMTPFLLDNRVPEVTFTDIAGNLTAEAVITVRLEDPHSGLRDAAFQFVKKDEQPSDASWQALTPNGSGIATISTLNQVYEDGKYTLFVKSSDQAGNEVTVPLDQSITIDSTSTVRSAFLPASDPNYVNTHLVEFYLSGIVPANVKYAVTSSVARPTNDGAYTTVEPIIIREAGDSESVTAPVAGGEYGYVLPIDPALNGMVYVHVVADPGDGSRLYTFAKAYYFDNQPPTVGFSRTAVPYPQQKHEVTVAVAEEAGRAAINIRKFQWVKEGSADPDALSGAWLDLPASGLVEIDAEGLIAPGETVNFRLFAYAADAAGNMTITSTGLFALAMDNSEIPSGGKSNLIHLYGDSNDGYTGIIKLDLDSPDKRGYEYSISADGGTIWSRWQPYTNFVSVELPTDNTTLLKIQLKFRKNGGPSGDLQDLIIGELPDREPVYALAKLGNTKPVKSSTGVDIQITPPLGVRVKPAADNPPSGVEQRGNTFKVRANGYYAFDLTDLGDTSRTDKLYVVVDNIDDTPPVGSIYYMSVTPTNGNAVVKLESNEAVRVLNNNGRNTYTFTDNGSFTFRFADEAGNEAMAVATVSNIDKTAPSVRIVRTYEGQAGSNVSFGTILGETGNVRLASGVILTVEKSDPQGKDFNVVGGQSSIVTNKNGTYSFTVSDSFGNTTIVSDTINHVVESAPIPASVETTFVDVNGVPLPESMIKTIGGKRYAKGKVQLSISGETMPDNLVFSGVKPALNVAGEYTNLISDNEGKYTLTRIIEGNGSIVVPLTDILGQTNKLAVKIEGLDNTPPSITLSQPFAGVVRNKANFDAKVDLGGYTVSDNVSEAANVTVTVTELDLSTLGHKKITYTATDEVGNSSSVTQEVYVVNGDGLLIFANGMLISSSLGQTTLFDSNKLTFTISGFNRMNVGGTDMINEWGTFDVLYQSGLYREGQLKTIATKLTYDELVSKSFAVEFPKAGWYTIIVRTQEREREFATFFVSSVK